MSHIDDLIRHHCPRSVECRAIGEFVRKNGMPMPTWPTDLNPGWNACEA